MAADPTLQIGAFIKKLEKLVEQEIPSRVILQKIGQQVAERVAKRTRLGYGVTHNGGIRMRLKEMRQHSEAYRQFRFEHPDKLSPLTAPGRHNLTLTGDMLENLTTLKVDVVSKRVDIGFVDEFSRIKARVNSQRGWKFLHLTDVEIKALSNFYKREVAKLVRDQKNL